MKVLKKLLVLALDIAFYGCLAILAWVFLQVFVFTSFREGLANATIEAQASGLPCLLSTGVPQLAQISRSTEFADLSEGAHAWAQKALTLYRSVRPDRSNAYLDALSAGFDIQESADWLADLYLANSRR